MFHLTEACIMNIIEYDICIINIIEDIWPVYINSDTGTPEDGNYTNRVCTFDFSKRIKSSFL